MPEYQNPCGGLRWKLLPSGLIEVEGEGIPTVRSGSLSEKQLQQTWRNWGALLRTAALKHSVPVSWLLAIATMETGYLSEDPTRQAHAVSPVGALGIMQVMPATGKSHGAPTPESLFDPRVNIDVAARLVSVLNNKPERGGLPGISAVYNSGRLCTTDTGRNEWMLLADANYPRRVIEWNNTAIESGLIGIFGPATATVLGGAVGLALALVVAGAR